MDGTNSKKKNGHFKSRRDVHLRGELEELYQKYRTRYGPTRLFSLGLVMVDCLPAKAREELMGMVGEDPTAPGIRETVRSLFNG